MSFLIMWAGPDSRTPAGCLGWTDVVSLVEQCGARISNNAPLLHDNSLHVSNPTISGGGPHAVSGKSQFRIPP
jgi:hypothetical protein